MERDGRYAGTFVSRHRRGTFLMAGAAYRLGLPRFAWRLLSRVGQPSSPPIAPDDLDGPPDAGVREPRAPKPASGAGEATLPLSGDPGE